MSDVEPRLIDVPGCARYLGVTERFVRQMVFDRRMPYVKVGRAVRFDLGDLDAWIAENRTEAEAEAG